jgi:hypothetical protein
MIPSEPAGGQWRLLWFFALGAGWASVLILVMAHLVLGKAEWLGILDGSRGWMVYPPLGTLPQAIPGNQPDAGVLLGAVLCGVIFLVAWLLAFKERQRSRSKASGRRFWLSLVLLVPVGVAVSGTLYSYQPKRSMAIPGFPEFSEPYGQGPTITPLV